MATLVDSSGNDVLFERPFHLSYLHDAKNDRNNTDPTTNPYHDKYFTFYNGSFPSTLDENGKYGPLFSVFNGTQMSNDEGNYIVKAKEIFQLQHEETLDRCSMLNLDNMTSDPSMELPTAEDIIPVTIQRLDEPDVEGPPAIIDGVIQ